MISLLPQDLSELIVSSAFVAALKSLTVFHQSADYMHTFLSFHFGLFPIYMLFMHGRRHGCGYLFKEDEIIDFSSVEIRIYNHQKRYSLRPLASVNITFSGWGIFMSTCLTAMFYHIIQL